MYYRRTELFFKILVSQALVGLLILVSGLAIVYFAQGYRFNYRTFKVEKTGVIYLSSLPKAATFILNGKVEKEQSPFSKNLAPGYYDLEIKKDGFVNWEMRVKVLPELVNSYKDVVLFRQNPKISELTDQNKIKLLNEPTDILAVNASDNLSYNSHEIWLGNEIIARFSGAIYKVVWYPDTEHILYQQNREIRIMEKTGTNDTLLVTLSDDRPADFIVGSHGQELYFRDGGGYKIAEIR